MTSRIHEKLKSFKTQRRGVFYQDSQLDESKEINAPIDYESLVKGPMAKLRFQDKIIYVLGTAHISAESIKDVENFINKGKPDVVCVELCQSRYNSILEKDRWKNLDIVQVIKKRKVYLLMSSLILSAFQKKMGEENNIKPGAEMMTGIELAHKNNIKLALVDRDIQITLKRAWQSMGFFTKMLLASEMISSLLVKVPVEEQQIEEMKRKDILDEIFDNLPGRYTKIKEIIITERDKYLSQKIKMAALKNRSAKTIFAIVGAGHLPGIKKWFHQTTDLKEIEQVAKKSKIIGVIKFILPIFIIMGLFYAFTDTSSTAAILKNILTWSLIKAATSGLFTLVLLAHPLSILAAAVTAPISNFNPILKPGWVAALIESKFHKPNVSDFESIAHDSQTLLGFFKNKVIKIFLVFTLPQLGSSIGTGLALWYIANF